MTSHNTGSASFSFSETYRYPPPAESGDCGRDQAALGSCMWIVTNLAGSPFFQLIDMNVMCIVETVSEACLGISQLVIGHFIVMAAEAKSKIAFVERIFSSMSGMAGIAIAIGNRFVNRLAGKHRLVMTNDAQIRTFTFQHEFHIGLMGIMTTGTVAICNGGMRMFAIKLGSFMTHETESCRRFFELGYVIALMDIVTGEAISGSNRAMNVFFDILPFMTFIAQPHLAIIRQKKSLFFDFGMPLPGRFVT